MKNILFIPTLILFVSLVSCDNQSGNAGQQQTSSTRIPNSSINSKTGLPFLNNTAQVTLNPEHGKPGHRCDIAVGAPLTDPVKNITTQTNTDANVPANSINVNPTTTTATTVVPGMNPQHGQPGHRCDLAVGAPLSDTLKAKSVKTNTAINVPANKADVKPATVTPVAPGMNPQHGQPGHRCDLAVGAPLADTIKKKSIQTDSTQSKTAINVPANYVEVKPSAPKITATAPGMNPKHGEPGHRCDIAVGAPLNSKPKQ